MTTTTTYGPGGYDPDAPDGNVVDERQIEVPDPEPTTEDRVRDLEAAYAGDPDAATRVRERAAEEPPSNGTRTR